MSNSLPNRSRKTLSLENLLRIFIVLFGAVIFVFNALNSYDPDLPTMSLAVYYIIIVPFYMAYVSRRNWMLLFIFICIGYFNYSIVAANYFGMVGYSFFTSFSNSAECYLGYNILMLFLVGVVFFTPFRIKESQKQNMYILNGNR
ncbi:MAG: hypothetical protein LBM16_03950, partial [Clostridiales bacterium]|nr:hypothetical protein [Clostridiales bacterium]